MKAIEAFIVAMYLVVLIVLTGCSVTISYDLPSKQIQDWFVGKKK